VDHPRLQLVGRLEHPRLAPADAARLQVLGRPEHLVDRHRLHAVRLGERAHPLAARGQLTPTVTVTLGSTAGWNRSGARRRTPPAPACPRGGEVHRAGVVADVPADSAVSPISSSTVPPGGIHSRACDSPSSPMPSRTARASGSSLASPTNRNRRPCRDAHSPSVRDQCSGPPRLERHVGRSGHAGDPEPARAQAQLGEDLRGAGPLFVVGLNFGEGQRRSGFSQHGRGEGGVLLDLGRIFANLRHPVKPQPRLGRRPPVRVALVKVAAEAETFHARRQLVASRSSKAVQR
jgi:hypothetical protein